MPQRTNGRLRQGSLLTTGLLLPCGPRLLCPMRGLLGLAVRTAAGVKSCYVPCFLERIEGYLRSTYQGPPSPSLTCAMKACLRRPSVKENQAIRDRDTPRLQAQKQQMHSLRTSHTGSGSQRQRHISRNGRNSCSRVDIATSTGSNHRMQAIQHANAWPAGSGAASHDGLHASARSEEPLRWISCRARTSPDIRQALRNDAY